MVSHSLSVKQPMCCDTRYCSVSNTWNKCPRNTHVSTEESWNEHSFLGSDRGSREIETSNSRSLTSGLLPKLERGNVNQSRNVTKFVFCRMIHRLHNLPGPRQCWVIIKQTSSWVTMIILPFQDCRDLRCVPRTDTGGCEMSMRTRSDTWQKLVSSVPGKLVKMTWGS